MSALTDFFGVDNQPWISNPDRNCSIVGFDDPKWAGFHADRWYPTEANETPELARTLCADCPVIAECLQYAMNHAHEGIWGGTTTTRREELRTNPRCGTRAGYKRHRDAKEKACGPCNEASNAYARERAAAKKAAA